MTEPTPVPRRPGMFAALASRNFRFYSSGQLISLTGAWFQNLTLSLIIVELTGSASALALVTVAQFGPMLVIAPLAGRIADAWPPRRILLIVAGLSTAASIALALALSAEHIQLPLVYGFIFVLGVLQAFERVTGNAFIFELVGPGLLQNAVVLMTLVLSVARSFGPGLAGLAFLTLGPAVCLVINAATFVCAFIALMLIDHSTLVPRPLPEGQRVSMIATLRQAWGNVPLRTLLIVNVVVALAAMNLAVVLTAVVAFDFGGDAGALGAAHTLNAIGAIVGGLAVTRLRVVAVATLAPACVAFGVALALNGLAPTLILFLCAAPILGIGLGAYQGVLNSAAQGATPPYALGRTMSLLTQGGLGMAPVGAVIAGLLIDATSGRVALLIGATVCALAGVAVWLVMRRRAEPLLQS